MECHLYNYTSDTQKATGAKLCCTPGKNKQQNMTHKHRHFICVTFHLFFFVKKNNEPGWELYIQKEQLEEHNLLPMKIKSVTPACGQFPFLFVKRKGN